MKGKPKKPPREKDLTSRYLSGGMDEDRVDQEERFSKRSKHAVQNKLEKTAALRAADDSADNVNDLPVGEVVQVYSLFSDVEGPAPITDPPSNGAATKTTFLCVIRKTLTKASETAIVVGDQVRFRATGSTDDQGRPEAVIEQILPRRTILTRAESFKGTHQHPIVANADQMLIVASLLRPRVKWGLVDRMIVAAQSGKLQPIVCLNKIDLAQEDPRGEEAIAEASEALAHYSSMDIITLRTAAALDQGLDQLRDLLRNRSTVLAGHSGVGKSSLIRAVQPSLDIRVGDVSLVNEKGMHTTTSARRYLLDIGGSVIDTPGVKQFGLWGVSRENLSEFFPDVAENRAPAWRVESMQRIQQSLPEPGYS
ncbi:MAG TPA: ribosome small subunit-dependent GTPase A [Tepidisphaeraceae bacterium]